MKKIAFCQICKKQLSAYGCLVCRDCYLLFGDGDRKKQWSLTEKDTAKSARKSGE